ncbi:MAG: hydroxymethylpyrimidine/phosphomethylpyrimidine kinase [Chlamydiales bacterium]
MPEGSRGAWPQAGTSQPARATRVLIVGGLDPSGGAGVTVDESAVRDQGCQCELVLTARTDQDDREVRTIGARDPHDWLEEALASFAAGSVHALKFGLLPGREHVTHAAQLVRALRERSPEMPVIVDPVLASSSGHEFLDAPARAALCAELASLGVVLTPNLPEAARLVGAGSERLAQLVTEPGARLAVAQELLALGARGVVLKAGHGAEQPARELVLEPGSDPVWLEQERLPGGGIRGSGCRHASVLACGLALGEHLPTSARRAATYVAGCIRAAATNY